MPLTGTSSGTVDYTDFNTVFTYDLDTFDAHRVIHPTVVYAEGKYTLLYDSLSPGNRQELGGATSLTGDDFLRISNQPLWSPQEEPYFATYRTYPVTMMYEDGLYKLWFGGNTTNLSSQSNTIRGFGYATSLDGVNWDINPEPIDVETGAYSGIDILEVVKLGETYIGYFRDHQGRGEFDYYYATSSDGINFSEYQPFSPQSTYIWAATEHNGQVLGIWYDETPEGVKWYAAKSNDGIEFEITHELNLPASVTPTDITVDGG